MAGGNLSCPRVVRAFVILPFLRSRARKTGHPLHLALQVAGDSRPGRHCRPKRVSGAIRGEVCAGCWGHPQGERIGSTTALKTKAGLAWMWGAGDPVCLHAGDRR